MVGWHRKFFVHFGVQAPKLAQMFVGTFRTDSEEVPKNQTFRGEERGNFVKVS